ncbi:hypothetical protein LTR56_021042 [Elasticomyces elasticus]|nr:hypothetical protein LTR56_021042 [Elasticomyces elasticus]KAK3646924.1 hypothetical protein LTR22_014077 [Elasticomyces elasticus]KAK4909903.1 hypothetical protein LTR49_021388 [Elasticomyces elasticus]KAK5750344.1 hypothetical protein LTS12_019605 [Elasticomyces elasticus]
MPICIECRYPVPTLYTTYSKADDKALGKGVRLTQCPRCKRFADKYVEHDFVVLFIDLVLIKPQPSIIRFATLLLLFDVYLTWARIEKATPGTSTLPGLSLSPPPPLPPFPSSLTDGTSPANTTLTIDANPDRTPFLTNLPILAQYTFFLLLCTLETLAFHLPIRYLLSLTPGTLPWPFHRKRLPEASLIPHYPKPALISTSLLVSSFTKLFPLLLLVWSYDLPSSASAVSWAVIINNVAALEILLDCGFARAILLCAFGAVSRAGVGWAVLRLAGVKGGIAAAGIVETGDLIGIWGRVMALR